MKPRFLSLLIATLLGQLAIGSASAQTINSTTNTGWTGWQFGSGYMVDPENDQQTGQGSDDFAGDATTTAALQIQSGEASFDAGVDYMFLRARFNAYSADDAWGNGGNWGTGMDLDGDGKLDVIMMFSEGAGKPANRTHEITFGLPGAGANDGPSTTSWTFPTQTAISLTVGETYNLQNASTEDGVQIDADDDAWLTFGLSFAQLQTAIQTIIGGAFSSYTVDYNSRIAMVAFTSTQDNALNQDLAGTSGNTSGTGTWADYGAISPGMGPGGYIPEPGTYAQIGAFLLVGLVAYYRRRERAKSVVTEVIKNDS